MRRLSKSEVKPFRNSHLKKQNNVCLLCGEHIETEDAVLDHDHKSGECRGILHRGCNAMLGKIENAMAICKVPMERLGVYLGNVHGYIQNAKMNVLHPTHRTELEKKQLKAKRERTRRRNEKLEQIKQSKKEST